MILLLGGTGLLGSYVWEELQRRECGAYAPSHDELNMEDGDALATIGRAREYDTIINCAGVTTVEVCEDDPGMAYRVNALAMRPLLDYVPKYMIYISTVSVLHPTTSYARSKLQGEEEVLRHDGLVVRTSRIWGAHPRSFISRILQDAMDGNIVYGSSRVFAPTHAEFLASRVCDMMVDERRGVETICGGNTYTYYEFIRSLLDDNGYSDVEVEYVEDEDASN